MKRFIAFFLMIFTLGVTAQMADAHGKQPHFNGTWGFKCDEAPYGFNDGKLVILEKTEKTTIEVTFSDGTKLTGEDVKIKEGVLTFSVSVDYDVIEVKLKRKGEKLAGSAITPEGALSVEATLAKNKH